MKLNGPWRLHRAITESSYFCVTDALGSVVARIMLPDMDLAAAVAAVPELLSLHEQVSLDAASMGKALTRPIKELKRREPAP